MKKEKIFHPNSRKADQLARKSLRVAKLHALSSKRAQKQTSRRKRIPFFNFLRRLLSACPSRLLRLLLSFPAPS